MLSIGQPLYRAIVVGLGRIGQGYDYYQDNNLFLTTHASAYSKHPLFCLVGGVDIDYENRRLFERKYHLPTFSTIDSAMETLKPTVISLATPTNKHLETFMAVVPHRPRAVILEKPIAGDIVEARTIVESAHDHNIALLVNYVRRYEPGTQTLKEKLEADLVGTVYKGVVYYDKGLMNNGSHFIDLLDYLFGYPSLVSIISPGRSFKISGVQDREPDFVMSFSDMPVTFLSTRHECFTHSEVKLFGERGVVMYGEGKIQYRISKQDPVHTDYRVLNHQLEHINSSFNRYQFHVLTALGNALLEGTELKYFNGKNPLEILEIIKGIHD